ASPIIRRLAAHRAAASASSAAFTANAAHAAGAAHCPEAAVAASAAHTTDVAAHAGGGRGHAAVAAHAGACAGRASSRGRGSVVVDGGLVAVARGREEKANGAESRENVVGRKSHGESS